MITARSRPPGNRATARAGPASVAGMPGRSPSLTRRPLTRDDAQASADLLNALETVDRIGEHYTAEDTLTELVDPYADLERGSLAAFDGDAMVGYMKLRFKPSADEVHRVFLDGGVHPAHRRRGGRHHARRGRGRGGEGPARPAPPGP